MRFNKKNCRLDTKIIEITKEVAKKYLECLNNREIFNFKLKRLIVRPFELPVKHPYAQTRNTQASNEILIVYDETMSSKFLAFIIAHELAHILIYPEGDLLKFEKKRIQYQKEGKEHIIENKYLEVETEEAMADYMASYIVSKMNFEDQNNELENYLQKEKQVKKLALIKALEASSGKSLMETERIDDYCIGEDEITISNIFWYNAVTHCMD